MRTNQKSKSSRKRGKGANESKSNIDDRNTINAADIEEDAGQKAGGSDDDDGFV